MVKVCEAFGCTTTEEQRVSMHRFPKQNLKQRNAWITWITQNRPDWNLKSKSRICELHFVPGDYVRQDTNVLKHLPFPRCNLKTLKMRIFVMTKVHEDSDKV